MLLGACRSERFRKRWFARRLLELLVFTGLFLFIMDQYIHPTIQNSLQPLHDSDWGKVRGPTAASMICGRQQAWLALLPLF